METPLSVLPLRYGDDAPDFVASETYLPDDATRRDYGQLFVIVRLSRPAPFQTTLAPAIIESLRDAYFVDPSSDPADAFERALTIVNERIATIAAERGPDLFQELSSVIGVVAGNMLHLSVAGDASVYLKRGPVLVNASEGLVPTARTPDNLKTFFHVASGEIRPTDAILLSTNDLLAVTTEHHVRAALQPQNYRTPRLLKAKLGIRSADLVLLLTGEPLHVPSAVAGTGSASWSQRMRQALLGAPALDADQELSDAPSSDLAALYETPEEPSKLTNTWALVRSNVRRSVNSISKRVSGQPLSSRGSRNAIVGGLVAILIVVAAILWIVDARARSAEVTRIQGILDQIADDRTTAYTRSIYDKATAKTVLAGALERATKLRQENEIPELQGQIEKEIAQIQDLLNKVDNVYVVPQPTVAVDLAQDRGGIQPLGLFAGGGSLWAYDRNALYKIDLDKVDRRKVEVPELTDVQVVAATYISQQEAVLLLTADQKVIEYRGGNFTLASTEANTWKTAVDLAEYREQSAAYFLDASEQQVWKYARGRSSFGTPAGKIPSGTPITDAISLAVDGSIFVLTSSGELVKLYNDKPAAFAWENFTESSALAKPTDLFTDTETADLYVLEPDKKRVVVTSKQGRYKAQYLLPKIETTPVDLVAIEAEQVLYVLDDTGKVYRLTLERAVE